MLPASECTPHQLAGTSRRPMERPELLAVIKAASEFETIEGTTGSAEIVAKPAVLGLLINIPRTPESMLLHFWRP